MYLWLGGGDDRLRNRCQLICQVMSRSTSKRVGFALLLSTIGTYR